MRASQTLPQQDTRKYAFSALLETRFPDRAAPCKSMICGSRKLRNGCFLNCPSDSGDRQSVISTRKPSDLQNSRILMRILVFALLLTLIACNDARQEVSTDLEPSSAAIEGSLPGTDRKRAKALTPKPEVAAISADALFSWAESAHSEYFPGVAITQKWNEYTYRFYTATGNYIAISGESVFILGEFSNNKITRVGAVEDFHCQVRPTDCMTPALLLPTKLTGTWLFNTDKSTIFNATATNEKSLGQLLYVQVQDAQGIISAPLKISPINHYSAWVTLELSRQLSVGRHTGAFLIRLCKDAGCSSEHVGSPVRLPYDFNVVSTRLYAALPSHTEPLVNLGTNGEDLKINIEGPGLDWEVHSSASWLNPLVRHGSGNSTVALAVLSSGLAEGRHQGTITVSATDGQTAHVDVSLAVRPISQFSLYSDFKPVSRSSLRAINGSGSTESIKLTLNQSIPSSTPWTASADSSWLAVSPNSGSSDSQIVSVAAVPSRDMQSGNYSSKVTFSRAGSQSISLDVDLVLDKAKLTFDQLPGRPPTKLGTIEFGGLDGRSNATQELKFSLNTGHYAWPWRIGGLPASITPAAFSGYVDQAGTVVKFAPEIGRFDAGTTSIQAEITAQVAGDILKLPVAIVVHADQQRLLPSKWGIPLTQTPTGTVLHNTLKVQVNFGEKLDWYAKTSAAWLQASPSGNTESGNSLTISADPNLLPFDTLSQAVVTISTSKTGVAPADIHVALWKSSKGVNGAAHIPVPFEFPYPEIVTDTIRPYLYISKASAAAIETYNIYSGDRVGSMDANGASIQSMAVSPDGARLYALDTKTLTMWVYDLKTQRKIGSWAVNPAIREYDIGHRLNVIRTNGFEVLLLSGGTQGAAHGFSETGRYLGLMNLRGPFVSSPDGNTLFEGDIGSGGSLTRHTLDYTVAKNGKLLFSKDSERQHYNVGSAKNIVLSADRSSVFTSTPARSGCAHYDANSLNFLGLTTGTIGRPVDVAATSDGRIFCGLEIWSGDYPDLTIHSAAGELLKSMRVSPTNVYYDRPEILRLFPSSDGMSLAIRMTSNEILLAPTPP